MLYRIRQLFSDGKFRDRDTAMRDLARVLGYERLGPRIHEVLNTDLLTAVRRGVLKNNNAELSLAYRSIEDYERGFLRDQFLASLSRTWTDREDAIRVFARWLGFRRTGATIDETARSIINGLLREGKLESDVQKGIRRK